MQWADQTTDIAPRIQLVAFARVHVKVGENKKVEFSPGVTAEQMALWMDNHTGFKVQPGKKPILKLK